MIGSSARFPTGIKRCSQHRCARIRSGWRPFEVGTGVRSAAACGEETSPGLSLPAPACACARRIRVLNPVCPLPISSASASASGVPMLGAVARVWTRVPVSAPSAPASAPYVRHARVKAGVPYPRPSAAHICARCVPVPYAGHVRTYAGCPCLRPARSCLCQVVPVPRRACTCGHCARAASASMSIPVSAPGVPLSSAFVLALMRPRLY